MSKQITEIKLSKGYIKVIAELLKERGMDYVSKETVALESLNNLEKPAFYKRFVLFDEYKEYLSKRDELKDYADGIAVYITFINKFFNHINESQENAWEDAKDISIAINFLPYTLDCLGFKYGFFTKTMEKSEAALKEEDDKKNRSAIRKNIISMKNELKLIKKMYDDITEIALLHKEEIEWYLNIEQQAHQK